MSAAGTRASGAGYSPLFPIYKLYAYISLSQAYRRQHTFYYTALAAGPEQQQAFPSVLCAPSDGYTVSRKNSGQYGVLDEGPFVPPASGGTHRKIVLMCLWNVYILLQAKPCQLKQGREAGYSSRMKTDSVLAPCAPSTSDCSMSAVLEGPAMKVPNPYSCVPITS